MPDQAPAAIEAKPPYALEAITLLRTMQQHHVQLSLMADQKASVLIGATFVVFTITMGQAATRGALSLPHLCLAFASFVSAALGVLAIVPATRTIRGPKANILFFGAFADLSEDEFRSRLDGVLRDPEAITQAMLREVYQMGMVLHRKKYRFLSYAYRVFLAGLLATFAAFLAQNASLPRLQF